MIKMSRNFEHSLAKNLKQNPKEFCRYCKSKLKGKSRLGDLQTMDSRLANDDKEKAKLLNDYFTSVFTHEKLENIPNLESTSN